MIDRLVNRMRASVERLLPWFDRAEHDRRARQTQVMRRRAIAARVASKEAVASYRRVRVGR